MNEPNNNNCKIIKAIDISKKWGIDIKQVEKLFGALVKRGYAEGIEKSEEQNEV